MELKKITVTTMGGQSISFHTSVGEAEKSENWEAWVESDDLFIFTKLSGNEISFVKRNVVSIDINDTKDNTDGVTTT